MYGVLDVETTGFDADQHGVVSIAIVHFNEKYEEQSHLYYEVRPYGYVWTEGAYKVHGISMDHLDQYGEDRYQVQRSVRGFIQRKGIGKLYAHYADFDKAFFNAFMSPDVPDVDFGCTMKLAKDKYICHSFKLSVLCRELRIDQEVTHNSLDDARAALKLLKKIRPHNVA